MTEKNVILDIDTKGLKNICSRDAFHGRVQTILIRLPYEEIEKRLRGRNTETEESITSRLTTAKSEIDFQEKNEDMYTNIIDNDDLTRAQAEFVRVLALA